jgi:hypothetical protein
MPQTLENLKEVLRGYYEAIDSQQSAQPIDLAIPIKQLETFSLNPPSEFHPQLRHYLESRSYRKAWTWLQGESPEKGSCGR